MNGLFVFLCDLGYGDDRLGISPTCFSSDQVLEARAFTDAHRHSGMKEGVILKDLLDSYSEREKGLEFRNMFRQLDRNYADPRLMSFSEYILNEWQ